MKRWLHIFTMILMCFFITSCQNIKGENLEIGSSITLGKYEQDDNFQNEKEAIEWLVIDKQEDKVLIISKYVLDSQPYNVAYQNTTWSSCTLRKWLNNDFLHSAFTEEEREKILPTSLDNHDNPEFGTEGGDYTTDKVFLLSIEEANKYFLSDGDRACTQTPYADNRSAFPSQNGTWWWLRSPGTNSYHAASVHPGGKPSNYGFFVNDAGNTTYLTNSGVRPAMWLSIN